MQIRADNNRWIALGLHLTARGVVLPKPYDPPYSAHSFVVPWAWYDAYYKQMHAGHGFLVRATALRSDLPTLRFLMEKVYAGYVPAEQRGWNWDAWFGSWDHQLARLKDARLDLHDAFAPWGKLESFQLDNHSGVASLKDYVSGSSSALLWTAPREPCMSLKMRGGASYKLQRTDAGQQPHAVDEWTGRSLRPAWYISHPTREGVAASIRCGPANIALTPISDTLTQQRENVVFLAAKPSYETLADGIAYIRMPTFIDTNDAALVNLLRQVKGVGKERVVIFDLRGNEGGNAPLGVLNYWFSKQQIDRAVSAETRYSSDSCFANALYFNLEEQLAAGLPFPAPPQQRQMLQSMLDAIDSPSGNDCTVKRQVTPGTGNLQSHHFEVHPRSRGARVIALVDNGCGSDCEFMAQMVAELPNGVLAGTSTYGVMGFTQPGYFVLPHSRVPFRLALSRTDGYGDGRSVDGYGISVDVVLPNVDSVTKNSLLALARALE